MMKLGVIAIVLMGLLMIQLVTATSPIVPNPANGEMCQNTSGKWLTVVYKGSFGNSYLVSDVYCQCNEINFIKITSLKGWKGCNSASQFMTESQFIDALKMDSSYAKSVNGNMDSKYIEIVQDGISSNKLKNSLVLIGILLLICLVVYFIIKKLKSNRKKSRKK